jgi:RNA recognition motif-containing protein
MADTDQVADLNAPVEGDRREPSRSRSHSRSRDRQSPPPPRDRSRSRSRDRRDFRRDRSRSRSRDRRDPRELEGSKTIFFGNLSYNIRDRDLRDLMERFGRVKFVKVGFNQRTGQSKGYAFVEFEHRRDAEEAFYKYQDYPLDGRRLRLDWDLGYDKKMRERGGERGERGGDRGGERGRPPPQYAPREHYDRPHRGYGGHGGYGGGGYYPGGDRGDRGDRGYNGGGGRYRSRSPPPRRSPPPEYGRKRSRSPSPGSDRRPEKRQRLDPR